MSPWSYRGWIDKIAEQPEEAIRSFEDASRMSPVDSQQFTALTGMGFALIELPRFDATVGGGKPLPHVCFSLRSDATEAVVDPN